MLSPGLGKRDRYGPNPQRRTASASCQAAADTVDVIERADESGERLYAELGADRPARVALPRQSGGSCPYGGIKAGRRMCGSRVTASGNG